MLLQEAKGRAHDLNTWGKFDYTRDPLIVLVGKEKMGLDKKLVKLKQLNLHRTLNKSKTKKSRTGSLTRPVWKTKSCSAPC